MKSMTNPTPQLTETELCDSYLRNKNIPTDLAIKFAENFGLNAASPILPIQDYRRCEWAIKDYEANEHEPAEQCLILKSRDLRVDWEIRIADPIIYLGADHSLISILGIRGSDPHLALLTSALRQESDEEIEDRCASGHT
jgi:hypothetical protein